MYPKKDNRYILCWAKKIRAIDILGGKCTGCGNVDPITMVFHHSSDEKEENINTLIKNRWSNVLIELPKCVLLCARCHSDHHCYDVRGLKIKRRLLELKGSSKCIECGYDHDGLDFHHLDEEKKKFNFGHIIARKLVVPIDLIIEELDKCVVLCKNCHIYKHFDVDRFNKFKDEIYRRSIEHKECPKPIDVNAVIEMLKSGVDNQSEIARRLGCRKTTISDLIQRNRLRYMESEPGQPLARS